jgi:hypothetical protein
VLQGPDILNGGVETPGEGYVSIQMATRHVDPAEVIHRENKYLLTSQPNPLKSMIIPQKGGKGRVTRARPYRAASMDGIRAGSRHS